MRGRWNLCAVAVATALSILFTASVPSAGFADEELPPAAPGNLARTADRSFELDLGGLRFDPLTDFPALPSDGHHLRETGPNFRLIQFDGPTRGEWLRGVRDQGIEVVQYIHPFTYVVWADAARLDAVRGVAGMRWAGELAVEFRVLPHQRERDGGVVPTMLLVSRHADEASVRDELAAAGARVHTVTPVSSHTSVVFVEVAGDRYLDLGHIPAVYTVQYIPPETGPRGEMSNQSVVGNFGPPPGHQLFPGYVNWLLDTGYDGSGVIVGIVDGGIRTTHQDLADRIAPCVPSGDAPSSCTTNSNNHGTHVAGAVAGTGATGITDPAGFLRGQGVAPGANVVQQRYPPFVGGGPGNMQPDGMLKIYRESALSGALLTNNSWGPTGTPQGYDIPTQQVDMITRDADPNTAGHQPVLPVWSIMNGNGDSGGACAPSSLGSPDEAKNLFAVGSTRMQIGVGSQFPNIFDVSPNSGHGPACDGRIVPHVVAPGCNTDSTTGTGDTAHSAGSCGTSMASPVVSGAVSIFIERYRDLHGADPSPALIKAAFTAVATNLEGFRNADNGIMGHPPDRFQGWGRVDLDAVANPVRKVMFFDQEVVFTEGGQDWSIQLVADDPSEPVRLMLIWTDAPGHGLGGSTPAWVNDLDLTVEAGADTYLGNVIGSDGFSTTGGTADERNNMEGVFLRPDQHDGNAFSVTVFAANLSGDALNPHDPSDPSQDFALACYNCAFPSGGVLQVTPGTLDFEEVPVGETGDARSLTLANSGTKSVTVNELTGPEAPFAPSGGSCDSVPFVLEPTASCTLDFSFSPTSQGLAEGEVTILSDAPSSSDTVPLQGTGIEVSGPELAIELEEVAAGLTRLTDVRHAGDGSGRLFIAQQDGQILILADGEVLATPFLDIASIISCCGERGLLGVAFHPDYASNGFFYVNYTNPAGNTVIARYSVSAADPDIADPDSSQIVLTFNQPFSNHNGGQIAFGPDGFLYIASGDGGSGGDPQNNAQTLSTLLGKLLRIDVDGDDFPGNPNRNYAIPPDNPFVGMSGLDEIWAYGLRNPWRFSFDRATGDVWIGDVGQSTREEIDLQPAASPGGENYGWKVLEGTHCFSDSPPGTCADFLDGGSTLPVLEYARTGGHCSVTGGYRYRGDDDPQLQGVYFYADFCSGQIWGTLPRCEAGWESRALLNAPFNITTFGEDEAGNLYVSQRSNNPGQSRLHQIVVASASGGPVLTPDPDTIDFGPSPGTAEIVLEHTGTGADAVVVEGLELSDPANFSVDPDGGANPCGPPPICLAPGSTCTMTVSFDPQGEGDFEESLIFDANSPTASISLLGSSTPPPTSGLSVLVRDGDEIPGFGPVTNVNDITVNDQGEWLAELSYQAAGGQAQRVILLNGEALVATGDPVPPAPSTVSSPAGTSNLFKALNNQGSTAFRLSLSGGPTASGMYFDVEPFVLQGDIATAPQFSPDTPYTGFFRARLDDSARLFLVGSVNDDALPGSTHRALVWFEPDGEGGWTEDAIAVRHDVLPGMDDGEFADEFGTNYYSFKIDNERNALYTVTIGGAETALNGAIYYNDTLLVRKGDESPIPGSTYSDIGNGTRADMNNLGDYVFRANLSDLPTDENTAILRNNVFTDGLDELFIRQGDPAPGTGETITGFGSGPSARINDSGDVIWFATLTGDTGMNQALFANDRLLMRKGVTTVNGDLITTVAGTATTTGGISRGFTSSQNGRYVLTRCVLNGSDRAVVLIDLATGELTVTPDSLDFGEVPIDTEGGPLSLSLTNTGTAAVTVDEITGPDAPFAAAGGTCDAAPMTLEPEASCTLDFTFGPTAEGPAESAVTIESDAPSSPDTVALHGIGIGVAKPELAFDPPSLDFGDVEVGETSPSQSSTLHNTGDADATGLAFGEPGAGFDADATTCGSTLPAGGSCPVSVTFTPSEAGPAVAVLDVDSDEGAAAGLGLAGHGLVEGAGSTAIALEVDPDVLTSDGNRVLEPGELVVVAPAWRNDDTTTKSLEGTAADFTGPDGADYILLLDAAQYGDVGPGETASCLDGGACYQLGVTNPAVRPAIHWDSSFEELLSDDTTKTWTLHIGESFLDVPKASPFYRSVETLLHAQVTGGCSDTEYCPTAGNSRGQMPVFVLRAHEGGDFVPPACVEGAEPFADVPAASGFCPWIQELASRGVVAGCGEGVYCPNEPVNRQQMAIFLLRTLEGGDYTPPACTGRFEDVPCSSVFAPWIEELADRGVTGGCSVDPPLYCPTNAVNRQQMAVFVSTAFGLDLYGP